jgi:NhaP-type Na+/H+ or K+/H+ antiporter
LPTWLHFQVDDNPTLTVALALAVGMAGQAIAHHLRLPKIVLLIVLGVLLGPDVGNVVQPGALGDGLLGLVGFAVAIILFEGGMSLDLRRLRHEQRAIRQLITFGAAASLAAGAFVAWILLGWSWQLSLLFGTLVVVTGPTVVTPLLRRLRVEKRVSTVLEAEGVLIDAVGAITAAVVLELVLKASGESWALALPTIAGRLLFGVVFGLVFGLVLGSLLRVRNLIPEGLENTFTLAWAVLVFQAANAVVHESGIAAVTVAGMWIGNTRTHVRRELAEFKEQLTVMLIGMLFVLLVADVRIADVVALGQPGLLVAVGIIVLVRPLSVIVGTLGTDLGWRERVFVGWIGPRGIVAAAVASLFGYQLERVGIPGGAELRALVFLVIGTTVFFSGVTGGLAARILGLRRPSGLGWIVIGDDPVAHRLAQTLGESRAEVVLVDPAGDGRANMPGVHVIETDPLDPTTAELAELEARLGAAAAGTSPAANYLFAEKTRRHAREVRFPVLVEYGDTGVTPEMIHDMGGEILFGSPLEIGAWVRAAEADDVVVCWLRRARRRAALPTGRDVFGASVALVHARKGFAEPLTNRTRLRRGSRVAFLVERTREATWTEAMQSNGWAPL